MLDKTTCWFLIGRIVRVLEWEEESSTQGSYTETTELLVKLRLLRKSSKEARKIRVRLRKLGFHLRQKRHIAY